MAAIAVRIPHHSYAARFMPRFYQTARTIPQKSEIQSKPQPDNGVFDANDH
jgi:hypothetical protein